jgi:hypothetical protein
MPSDLRLLRQAVPVVDGALGYWSASNVAQMMTSSDFETRAEAAQRWLANFRPKDNCERWRAARTVRAPASGGRCKARRPSLLAG